MEECCKHLHREATKELGFKDKRIGVLEKEVTRLSEPTKEFWNNETRNELTRLKSELEQQRFNNENNLSIDQKVADELARLKEENEKLTTQLVSYEATIGFLKDTLSEIANEDFRGNRPSGCVKAFKALAKIKQEVKE